MQQKFSAVFNKPLVWAIKTGEHHVIAILECSKGDFSKLKDENFVEEVIEFERQQLGLSKGIFKIRRNIKIRIRALLNEGEEKFKERYNAYIEWKGMQERRMQKERMQDFIYKLREEPN